MGIARAKRVGIEIPGSENIDKILWCEEESRKEALKAVENVQNIGAGRANIGDTLQHQTRGKQG